MAKQCGCGCNDAGGMATRTRENVATADRTVETIGQRPAALAVLERFGINHCCGAHLTLREAAAAAGVELTAVLDALAATA